MALYIAKNNDTGKRWATIAIYRECQRNHSAQSGRGHVADGCPEFLGHGEERSELAFYCSKCGCNRDFHRKEEIPVLADPTTVQTVHELAAPRPHHAAGAPPRQLPPVPVVFLRNGEVQPERTGAPRRGRTQFTKAQQAAMRAHAESLGWGLRGKNQLQIYRFCLEIGITLQNFKLWMRNNKKKYNVEAEESAASCVGL